MVETLLPQNPFDGQVYIDFARDTRWVYSKALELWERQGIAEPPAPANETTIGTLKNTDKAFIDTIQSNTPGSFSLIVDPKSGLTGVDGDNIISGNIKLVSDSLDIKCTLFTPVGQQPSPETCNPADVTLVPDGPQPPALNFSLSTNFLNSLVIDLPGPKGDIGPKGLIGVPGKHGFNYLGPPGEDGKTGVNGTTVYTMDDVLYEDFPDELTDAAVVDMALDALDQGGKKLIITNSKLDLTGLAANRLSASMLQRYIEYPPTTEACNNVKLSDWILKQPVTDSTRLNLNLLRLPTGSDKSDQSSVQFDATVTLNDLITEVVEKYQANLDKIDEALGERAKKYIESIDAQARTILADLASKLSSSEFSLPAQDFCLTFASCDFATVYPEPGVPTPIAPSPPVPTPIPPTLPPPYSPTPSTPPLPPSPTVTPTPVVEPPLPPPEPPVFPPVPTPTPSGPPRPPSPPPTLDPPTPTPPTPYNPPPTPNSPVRAAILYPPGFVQPNTNADGSAQTGTFILCGLVNVPDCEARNQQTLENIISQNNAQQPQTGGGLILPGSPGIAIGPTLLDAKKTVTLNNRNWFYLQ